MSHCLLILDNPELELIYSINIKIYTDVNPLIKKNIQSIKDLFSHISCVDLIIVRGSSCNESLIQELVTYLRTNDKNFIPKMLISSKKDNNFDKTVDPKTGIKGVLKGAISLLGLSSKEIAGKVRSEFFPIPISFFSYIDLTNVDLFKRSKMGDCEFMYYKNLDAYADIPANYVANMKKAGHRTVYIHSTSRLKFVNFYTSLIHEKMNASKTLVQKNEAIRLSMDFVKSFISRDFSLSPEVQKNAYQAIHETIEIIKSCKKINLYANLLQKSSNNYSFQLSQITTYVCFHILDSLEWTKNDNYKKLSLASFFCDIVFTDDRLARIQSMDSSSFKALSLKEKKFVEYHAYLSSRVIEKLDNYPLHTEIIVRQHHGSDTGVGFPEVFSQNLKPLSIIFIIAQSFSHLYLKKTDSEFVLEKTIKDLASKYPDFGIWKRAISALEDLK